jgi:hypothetical protein
MRTLLLLVAVSAVGGVASSEDIPEKPACLTGTPNEKGVGKYCLTRDDCAGQWANYCNTIFQQMPMCTRLCDDNTNCGKDAFCGIRYGVRACFPKTCSDWTYTPGCEATNVNCRDRRHDEDEDEPPPAHRGAAICPAGIAWSEDGYGLRCDSSTYSKDGRACKDKRAHVCQASFYPLGPDYCERECHHDEECGDYAYCGYMEPLHSFSICQPRCPEPEHRALVQKPAALDMCLVEGGTAPAGLSAAGIGVRCASDKDCAGNAGARRCGLNLSDTVRHPDMCTMACHTDAECGRNAVCSDLDWNLKGDGKASGATRYCLPACWLK